MLLGALWWYRATDSRLRRRYPLWAILAGIWCLAYLICSLIVPQLARAQWSGAMIFPNRMRLVTELMALAPLLLLIAGSSKVALVAIAVASVDVIFPCWAMYLLSQCGWAAAAQLLISARHSPGWLPTSFPLDCFLLNRDLFHEVFVGTVAIAGPWILIAFYARRYLLRPPIDDGSPWPRRHCGNCMYNLHGIDAATCPECGRSLIT